MDSWRLLEIAVLSLIIDTQLDTVCGTLWSEWWTYSGVSGAEYWGKANKAWIICSKGKYQSPINIDPKSLVHDPNLKRLNVSQNKIKGILLNTGRDLKLVVKDTDEKPFIFTGGPLSYEYTLFEIKIHFGDNNTRGSEHSIGGKMFPLEIQLYGFNAEIHKNSTQALNSPNGIAAISILALVSEEDNINFDALIQPIDKVHFKGSSIAIDGFSVNAILPPLDYFVTYEGSLTQPGCMETVTWIILNKPLHISFSQLRSLRILNTSNGSQHPLSTNNFRSITSGHGRLIRTNIKSKVKDDDCYTMKLTSYEVNKQFKQDSPK
ncbi:carbonic anhydrase-related protein 10-like [Mytilus edulis]|uniref:carbonic anhydrase-related protein 10-like n=1 Tax=Mytilus edulis TaxID=6550 RepID=UPI0039EE3307